MGIHNEAGVEKIKLPKSKELIGKMLKLVTDTSDEDRAYVPFKHDGKDEVVLLVNNLCVRNGSTQIRVVVLISIFSGGISELEMTSIANDAILTLEESKITVKRVMVGSVMVSAVAVRRHFLTLNLICRQTSLNLPGFSLTCLLLPRQGDKYSSDRILQVLDAPASSPGWKFMYNGPPGKPSAGGQAAEPKQVRAGGQPVARKSHEDKNCSSG